MDPIRAETESVSNTLPSPTSHWTCTFVPPRRRKERYILIFFLPQNPERILGPNISFSKNYFPLSSAIAHSHERRWRKTKRSFLAKRPSRCPNNKVLRGRDYYTQGEGAVKRKLGHEFNCLERNKGCLHHLCL